MADFNDDEFRKAFGQNLRRLRKAKGMTMADLAHNCGLVYSQIARIETATQNPSITTTAKIARGLGIRVSELFEFER